MEELLNKLIQKGWKPFGKTGINERDAFVYMNKGHCIRLHKGVYANNILCGQYDLRQIVSKESGLWQFVCENGMIRVTEGNSLCNWLFGEEIYYDETQTDKLYKNDNYEYWLIESALCDEDKLEQFLLDNIKIEGK